EAAEVLADAACDVIVFHCTASSMEAGVEGDRHITEEIARVTGCRATSTASAVAAGLEALEARKVVLVSPYVMESHQQEITFISEMGIEVVGGPAMHFPRGPYPQTP